MWWWVGVSNFGGRGQQIILEGGRWETFSREWLNIGGRKTNWGWGRHITFREQGWWNNFGG